MTSTEGDVVISSGADPSVSFLLEDYSSYHRIIFLHGPAVIYHGESNMVKTFKIIFNGFMLILQIFSPISLF